MPDDLKLIETEFHQAVTGAADPRALEEVRVKYLGRKGAITELLKQIGTLPPEERRTFGARVNELKIAAAEMIESRKAALESVETAAKMAAEVVDVTLPGRRPPAGRKHIVTQALDEIVEILKGMGFAVEYGPDLETDYYNFEALNFPPNHPARDMQDTFWIDDVHLLRTHTSPVQIHVMERVQPPVRVIMPGRCFRNESVSVRSHVMFHQIEGLYVDEGVTFGDLKATLYTFLKMWLGMDVDLRFRPSFFPFTEPSAEVDVSCMFCKGSGCRVCKQSGWLELLGAGMVDPNVFASVGYDAEKYTGYAWGLGIERLTMMKYGIEDIRLFWQNDMRFLEQF
ncbi:MAG: phenylalanine--tRNA ligase subunit alpha [Verrucomicrobia bacterium]|nr:phenylalanine--tRNA ligase subunit alpha [Verrucomicrobiota bacterium]